MKIIGLPTLPTAGQEIRLYNIMTESVRTVTVKEVYQAEYKKEKETRIRFENDSNEYLLTITNK